MSEAPRTPNTSAFQPEDETKTSRVRRFAPLAGVVALMGTIVIAGTALANTRTAPEIDPSAVTVEASVSAEESSEHPTSTSASTAPRAEHDDDRLDDDQDDRNEQSPAYITPQVPLTYQDWDDDDDDWDDDWDDDDWDDDNDDDDDWDDDWDDGDDDDD